MLVGYFPASYSPLCNTACQVLPLSNQTSKISLTFSKFDASYLQPSGKNSLICKSHHASAPFSSKICAVLAKISSSKIGSFVVLSLKNAIGTPQSLWREIHQSGRFSIIEVIRLIPEAG